jgi:hypothetical protein
MSTPLHAHTNACGGEAWGKQRPMGLHATTHTQCRPGTMQHTSENVVWFACASIQSDPEPYTTAPLNWAAARGAGAPLLLPVMSPLLPKTHECPRAQCPHADDWP